MSQLSEMFVKFTEIIPNVRIYSNCPFFKNSKNLPQILNLTSIISIIEKVHLDDLNVYLDTSDT